MAPENTTATVGEMLAGGRAHEALAVARQVVAERPTDASWLHVLAVALHLTRSNEEAAGGVLRALQIAAGNSLAWKSVAASHPRRCGAVVGSRAHEDSRLRLERARLAYRRAAPCGAASEPAAGASAALDVSRERGRRRAAPLGRELGPHPLPSATPARRTPSPAQQEAPGGIPVGRFSRPRHLHSHGGDARASRPRALRVRRLLLRPR